MKLNKYGTRDFKKTRYFWKKSECQQLKINRNVLRAKKSGNVDIVTGMMLFLVLFLTVLFGFRVILFMVTAAGVEDALAASNLASAIIDIEEYGKNHSVIIADAKKAFQVYRDALCCNLKLDEKLNTTNEDYLAGNIEIKQYVIYNVRDTDVEIVKMDGAGRIINCSTARKGDVYTPDMVQVESTTIYSKIGFWVEGLEGRRIYAEKEKSIDIVRCDGE